MRRLFLCFAAALSLASCQDIIEVELPEGETRLIVNGRVTDRDSARVDVKWSVPYLNTDPNEPVTNALVVLIEDGVAVDTLTHRSNGRYLSDFQGEVGRSYRVAVTVPEREGYPSGTWTSATEALNRCNDADSIYSQYLPRAPFQQEGRYVFIHWSEAPGRGDHYRVRVFRNDTLQNQTFDLTVFNDDFNDGFVFPTPPSIPPIQIAGPDSVGVKYKVELGSISMGLFSYLNLLREQTLQVGGLFDPPPAPIVGNIYREGNENEYALGYFYA
ncbi:MAG: DUF4249 domain-containing protein, partial [Schleiferiaceae bacterium]|nr:DUF4249 domain-containing protein [Schleiferiaceae bacterium]